MLDIQKAIYFPQKLDCDYYPEKLDANKFYFAFFSELNTIGMLAII